MSVTGENENAKLSDPPIFDLNTPPEEPLDEKKVQFSIYNDINPEENKTKQDKEWGLRMTCTLEWFIRCSWINKFLFLDILCQTCECIVLENVLKSIESILSKDVMESMCYDSTNFCYDRIPADDNRALGTTELNKAMKDAYFWFLNLDLGQQVLVILKLLRLGGGGLVLAIYKSAGKYFKDRKAVGKLISALPEAASSDEEVNQKKIKENHKTKTTMQIGETLESEVKKFNKFAHKKQQQLERRNAELVNYKKLKGILEDENKKTKKGEETKETVDYLQILPIRLNRKIMSYIDDKTLAGYKKVGKYWSKMIDESINEKSGRKAINAKINKIIGIKPYKEAKKNDKAGSEAFEFVSELGPQDLINKKNVSEATLNAAFEVYEMIFSKKYNIKDLDSSHHPERCGAYDSLVGIIAGSTANNTIQFYSARTGARLNYLVFDLESSVTCLALHENRTHVFVGCKDGSLLSKDIRTNKVGSIFNGHSNAILSIFTTATNLLSASLDNTVKYFRLWSGICLLCVDLNPDLNISTLLLRKDKPSCAAIGTAQGFLVLADIEAKKFIKKRRLYMGEITQLANDGDILITGSRNGKIRVWDMNQLWSQELNAEDYFLILNPYYNIDVESCIVSLKVYKNQIFAGCENGTVKIIYLGTGKVFKTLKISTQIPITGIEITEDKLFMKLIIWHEKGIEIRTFSLQKSSSRKIPKEKDNQESKQKAPMETKKNKMSEMVLSGYVRASRRLIEVTPNAFKKTTFTGTKKPLGERCCTLPSLRSERNKKLLEFDADVFTNAYNSNPLQPHDFFLHTFPRLKSKNTK